MKHVLLIMVLFTNLIAFSQTKSIYFYFENQEITEKQFENLDERKTFIKETTNDTVVLKNAYLHKRVGKLDSVQQYQINLFLKKIIGKKFSVNKKTMIHLYSKNEERMQKDADYKKYWKWISSNRSRYQAYLIGTKNSQVEEDMKNHIYVDSYDLLKNLFFKGSNFDINHLLIKPDGEIYIYYGMNDLLAVLDSSVD